MKEYLRGVHISSIGIPKYISTKEFIRILEEEGAKHESSGYKNVVIWPEDTIESQQADRLFVTFYGDRFETDQEYRERMDKAERMKKDRVRKYLEDKKFFESPEGQELIKSIGEI